VATERITFNCDRDLLLIVRSCHLNKFNVNSQLHLHAPMPR